MPQGEETDSRAQDRLLVYIMQNEGTKSIRGIAKRTNRSYSTVRDWLVRARESAAYTIAGITAVLDAHAGRIPPRQRSCWQTLRQENLRTAGLRPGCGLQGQSAHTSGEGLAWSTPLMGCKNCSEGWTCHGASCAPETQNQPQNSRKKNLKKSAAHCPQIPPAGLCHPDGRRAYPDAWGHASQIRVAVSRHKKKDVSVTLSRKRKRHVFGALAKACSALGFMMRRTAGHSYRF